MDIEEDLEEIVEAEDSQEPFIIEEMMDIGEINDENQLKFSLIEDLEMSDQNHSQDTMVPDEKPAANWEESLKSEIDMPKSKIQLMKWEELSNELKSSFANLAKGIGLIVRPDIRKTY